MVYLGWKRSKSSGRRHVDFSAEITCPACGLSYKYLRCPDTSTLDN